MDPSGDLIQLLGYSTEDLLPSRIWDTDHKPLGPVLQTLTSPPCWVLTQLGLASVVEDQANAHLQEPWVTSKS